MKSLYKKSVAKYALGNMFDVIVVGAGPAGLVSAYKLLEEGYDVLILEREIRPNYNKLCAGYIPLEVFEKYNIPKGVADYAVYGVRFVADRKEWVVDFDAETGYNVDRNRFADFLATRVLKEGGIIENNSFVREVELKNSHAIVRVRDREYTSRIVILADGVTSRIAASIRGRFKANDLGITIQTRINPTSNFLKDNNRLNVILFGRQYSPFGYGWIFPKQRHLDVGLGTLISKAKGEKLEDYLTNILDHFNLEKSEPRYFPVPLSGPLNKVAYNRMLLAGDSAGHVSPLTGEGIKYSMHAGELAAETIMEYLKNRIGIKDIRKYYLKRLKKSFYKKLRAEKIILSILASKRLSTSRMLEDEKARRIIAKIYTDMSNEHIFFSLVKSYILTHI